MLQNWTEVELDMFFLNLAHQRRTVPSSDFIRIRSVESRFFFIRPLFPSYFAGRIYPGLTQLEITPYETNKTQTCEQDGDGGCRVFLYAGWTQRFGSFWAPQLQLLR